MTKLKPSEAFEIDRKSPSGLRWKIERGTNKQGQHAGKVINGVWAVRLNGVTMGANFVVWLLCHDFVPVGYNVCYREADDQRNLIECLKLNRKNLTEKSV